MQNKLRFSLITVPCIGVGIFFLFNVLAILFYPGYEKCTQQEKDPITEQIVCAKSAYIISDTYSFTQNFFSELGSINVNTDDDHYKTPNLENNKPNTLSMLFFNSSLLCVGIILITFYINFPKLFRYKEDSVKSRKFSQVCQYIGPLTGIMFAGVGAVPHDLSFGWHVFFANWAFLTLLPLSIAHTLAFKHSNYIKSKYSLGYMIFCILLVAYVYLIFWGPQIEPDGIFTSKDLAIQVIAQKAIVLTFIVSMIYQTVGVRKIL